VKVYLFGGIAMVVVLAAILHPAKSAALSVAQAPMQPGLKTRLHRHAVTAHPLVVYVAGALIYPGLFRLPRGARAVDAVRRRVACVPTRMRRRLI